MRGEIGAIRQLLGDEHVEHAEKQHDIRDRLELQMQIGALATVGATWIDRDDAQIGIARFGLFEPAKQYRMCERGIGASDKHTRGVIQVLVAARRRIRAESLLVAGYR